MTHLEHDQQLAHAQRLIRKLAETPPAAVARFCRRYVSAIHVRPMLTQGMLCVRKGSDGYLPADGDAPFLVLIDEDQPPAEQVVTLLHELFHAQLLIAGVARDLHDEVGIEQAALAAIARTPELTAALSAILSDRSLVRTK
jgi:hypothetical protein